MHSYLLGVDPKDCRLSFRLDEHLPKLTAMPRTVSKTPLIMSIRISEFWLLMFLIGTCCIDAMFSRSVIAQQSYPMLMSIEPISTQVGSVSEHTIRSRYSMEGTYRVLVSGSGVIGEVIPPEEGSEPAKSPVQALDVRFVVDEDALPGVREVRLATPHGVSTIAQLVVGHDPVTIQTADNHLLAAATPFAIPATLCGGLDKAEDVDLYKFQATQGQTVHFFVRCMKLQDSIHDLQTHADPILTLRDYNGSTIAASDNVYGADPFLSHTFDSDGEYYLEIRDVRYQGNPYWQYSIHVSQRPHLQAIFPLAVLPTEPTHVVAPVGYGLSDHQQAVIHLPDSVSAGVNLAGVNLVGATVDGTNRHGVQVVVDEGPFTFEVVEGTTSLDSAQTVTVPGGIHGRIARPSEIDFYAFKAHRGERYSFEVFARRVGSSLDSHLRLLDATGKQLQVNDDLRDGKRTYSDSRIENWTVPADGRYLLEVRDLNLRGGADYVYFLKATQATPHFRLFADTDKTLLTPGTSGVIFVRAERLNGFDGEIRLRVSGLPEGVRASSGRILSGSHVDGCVVLTAAENVRPDVSNIEIRGSASVALADGQAEEISTVATIYQEIYQPGGGRGHWPVSMHAVSIGSPADILAVKVTPSEVTLRRGESITLDIEIERADGFDKNVLLEIAYQHLSSVFGDPLPKGITVDASASNTLLTGGATKGKITLKAANDATEAKAVQFAVMANVSLNFVMKNTYASSPIVLNVVP